MRTLQIAIRLIASALPLLGIDSIAYGQDPDFGEIDDPLDGEYELFTVDDLVIGQTTVTNETAAAYNYILKTENLNLSEQSRSLAAARACYQSNRRQPQRTRAGRFFNLPYDVVVTLTASPFTPGATECTSLTGTLVNLRILDPQVGSVTVVDGPSGGGITATNTAVAMDDFNLDGFDDLFLMSSGGTLVATATTVEDESQGMTFGAVTALPAPGYVAKYDPATGDFNEDGLNDVAWIGTNYTVHFATVCPGDVEDTICEGRAALDVLLDPLDSQAQPITVTPVSDSGCAGGSGIDSHALAAGRFDSIPGDGLVVFNCRRQANVDLHDTLTASWYEFNPDWTIVGGAAIDTLDVAHASDMQLGLKAVAGRLDWFGDTEQAVFAQTVRGPIHNLCSTDTVKLGSPMIEITGVLSFNQNAMKVRALTGKHGCIGDIDHLFGFPWINGLAVGRFASIDDSPASESVFNPQIAVLLNNGIVRIYSVDAPTDFIPVLARETHVDSALALPRNTDFGSLNWLSAGDLQARSARLGPPSVIRLSNHSQPSIILGAPPMHVDYIQPDSSTGSEWEVVNFSAVPDTYNSSYSMTQTTTNQSSDTNRTSYTYTTTEKTDVSFSLKPPYLPSISGSLQTATTDKNEDVSENHAFIENEFKYNASATTGFGDEIWYADSSFNLYVYPVLGETVCPADNSECTPEQEQQLYVMFSGPESSGTGPAPGASTEWYQPVHEPGNIFSYPWNQTLLAQRVSSGIDLLSGPQSFFTDASSQAQDLNWSSGSGTDVTTGTTNNHSYEKSYSLTGGKQIGTFRGVNLHGNFDYSESSSVSSLNKSSSSFGASEGITIEKPGTFRDPGLYQYRVQPFISGRLPPAGSVDDVSLPETIQTMGPLQTAFAANPLDLQAGAWWGSDVSPYTQYIDVSLNHPVRWTKTDPTGLQESLNCLAAEDSRANCLFFNDPNPANLWNSEFYWMRGLLVTVGGPNGPQAAQATAGDDVVLQARVYNYSFRDMDASSSIKVRFYRQAISGTTPVGDSVLISERSAGPLPGFNSDNAPDQPNWTTVTAELDTSGLDGTYQIFWVVVWAEDASGFMVTELPGHGLSALPGTLLSIGDAPLEQVTLDGESRTFSNNVGYLHRKFYIAAETVGAPAPPQAETADPVLEIRNAMVTPASGASGGVIVSFDVTSEEAAAEHVNVQVFADGTALSDFPHEPKERPIAPLQSFKDRRDHRNERRNLSDEVLERSTAEPPRPFDVELLPFIPEGGSDHLEVPYRVNMCGTQQFIIAARTDPQEEPVTAAVLFRPGPMVMGPDGKPMDCKVAKEPIDRPHGW